MDQLIDGRVLSMRCKPVFVELVQPEAPDCVFVVERQLGDWSLAGSRLQATWDFFRNGRKLAPRLAAEAAR